jgi:hypothetical protein
LAQVLRSHKTKGLGGAADGRVFLAVLSSPGWSLAGEEGMAEEAPPRSLPPSDQLDAILRCITTPSSPWDAAREALIPWVLCAWQRRSGSLATSFLVSGSPLLAQPGVDVAAPVARRPADLDECRAGPLLPPPF